MAIEICTICILPDISICLLVEMSVMQLMLASVPEPQYQMSILIVLVNIHQERGQINMTWDERALMLSLCQYVLQKSCIICSSNQMIRNRVSGYCYWFTWI